MLGEIGQTIDALCLAQGARMRCRNWREIRAMEAPIKRASGGARRRRVAVAGLLAVAIAAAIAFTAAQALATAGSGAVSTYMARGPVSQSVVIGVPKSVTATKIVRVRVKGKVVTRKVSFTYPDRDAPDVLRRGHACDTAYQQLTIPPGGTPAGILTPARPSSRSRREREPFTTRCPAARRSSTRPAQASCSLRPKSTT